MSDALFVSNAVLWVVVVALALVVLALARQVGVLHQRPGPAAALARAGGPQPGRAGGDATGQADLAPGDQQAGDVEQRRHPEVG